MGHAEVGKVGKEALLATALQQHASSTSAWRLAAVAAMWIGVWLLRSPIHTIFGRCPPEMPKSCIYCCRIHSSPSPHRGSIFNRILADIFWPYYAFFHGGPLAEASPRIMASAHNRRPRPIFSSVLIVCAVLLLLFGLRAGLCVSCRSTSSMSQAEM